MGPSLKTKFLHLGSNSSILHVSRYVEIGYVCAVKWRRGWKVNDNNVDDKQNKRFPIRKADFRWAIIRTRIMYTKEDNQVWSRLVQNPWEPSKDSMAIAIRLRHLWPEQIVLIMTSQVYLLILWPLRQNGQKIRGSSVHPRFGICLHATRRPNPPCCISPRDETEWNQ